MLARWLGFLFRLGELDPPLADRIPGETAEILHGELEIADAINVELFGLAFGIAPLLMSFL